MKRSGLIKLSFKNLLSQKVFSISIILVLGIIFGVFVASANNTLSSNKNLIISESEVTDGNVLAAVRLCESDYTAGGCDVPEKYDEQVSKIAKKYNGEMLGARITYVNTNGEKVYVILERAGKLLNHEKTFPVLNEKIPIVKNANEKIDENIYQEYQSYSSDETPFYIMMDDTMTVMNFLFLNGFQMQSYEPLVVFSNEKNAFEFFKNESNKSSFISQLFNKTINAKEKYNHSLKVVILTFLSLFGFTVIMLTIFGIITAKSGKKNILIYKQFGATKRDVFRIFFLSGIELFIISVLITPITYFVTTLLLG